MFTDLPELETMMTTVSVPHSVLPVPRVALLAVGLVLLLAGGGPAAGQTAAPSSADSLTLERTVARVLETYPSVEAARREVAAAEARVGQARSGYWPRVSAVGTYRRQDPVSEVTLPAGMGGGGESISIQPNNFYDGHLRVRQTLYDFGATRSRIDQAEAGRTAAERRVEAERATLAFRAIDAFYTTLLAQARIDVQRDQVEQLKETLTVVQRQKAAGTATDFEVQSTRTRLSAARSQLIRLRSQRRRQEAELRRLLGTASGAPLSLRGTLTPSLTAADSARIRADTLAEQALLQHPSVRVAKAQLRAARQGVEVADQSDSPTLSLDAQGGVKNGYPSDINQPRLNESIGVSITVPLFEGFATERQIEEAEAQVQAAEARLTDVRRQVSTRVEQAASDLRALLDRLASTQQRVEQARTAAQLARTRYEAGTITNLDLLEAETELQRARLERTEVRYQVVLGRYALQRAAGTLLPLGQSAL
jgi:TolC family type I secretion outer membrane protein